ncbi:MAG: regulatory iron-sulfur-containing complex subunit RicT [Pseudomonadota bacterium]
MEQMEQKEAAPKQSTKKLVAGVQYRKGGKVYTFETQDNSLVLGSLVMVEGEGQEIFGQIIVSPREVEVADLPKNLKKILRLANAEDQKKEAARKEKSGEFFQTFVKKVEEHNLPMKPLEADLVEGGKKCVFTFFAEERVDFRALVKELASALHLRIEMRQIGARDEVKCAGAMGSCGQITCCSKHLRTFKSISIQMAKTQGLMPNPARFTGICGKLKCCLAYENEQYAEIRKDLPRLNTLVTTPQGDGKIIDFNILKKICVVLLDEGPITRVPVEEVKPRKEKSKKEEVKREEPKRVETKRERRKDRKRR